MAEKAPFIPYRSEVRKYVKKLLKSMKARAVVMYGSVAKGTYGVGSDIDLLVVADDAPKQFLKRLSFLNELNTTSAPIEVIAYTTKEFGEMIRRGHPSIFDALEESIVLYDDGLFGQMKEKFLSLKRKLGWIRIEDGWEKS